MFVIDRFLLLWTFKVNARSPAEQLNYFGVFEAEFIWFNGRWALITDFNPRFYNQTALDIFPAECRCRLLAFLDASSQTTALTEAVGQRKLKMTSQQFFVIDLILNTILVARRIFSQAARADTWQPGWLGSGVRPETLC